MDVKRMRCVIINKTPGKQTTYKLMCEFGVIPRS